MPILSVYLRFNIPKTKLNREVYNNCCVCVSFILFLFPLAKIYIFKSSSFCLIGIGSSKTSQKIRVKAFLIFERIFSTNNCRYKYRLADFIIHNLILFNFDLFNVFVVKTLCAAFSNKSTV